MNRDLLRARLAQLLAWLQKIESLASVGRDAFVADEPRHDLCAWYIVLSVESASSAAEHLISANGWGVPDTAGQEFEELGKHAVLSPALVTQMREAVGLRNVLVHQYTDVRWPLVYAAAVDLERLRAFAASVASYAGL